MPSAGATLAALAKTARGTGRSATFTRTARRFAGTALALGAMVASLLLPLAASAAEGRLTILFTGDNGGEVSPCG